MSADGHYSGVSGSGGVWINNNYLASGSWVHASSTACTGGAISGTGQYVLANVSSGSPLLSSNYGVSFSTTGANSGTSGQETWVSSTGGFMLLEGNSSNKFQYSTDQGTTWSNASSSEATYLGVYTTSQPLTFLSNATGSICIYFGSDNKVHLSTDYLQTSTIYSSLIGTIGSYNLQGSSDTKYVVAWSSTNTKLMLITNNAL